MPPFTAMQNCSYDTIATVRTTYSPLWINTLVIHY